MTTNETSAEYKVSESVLKTSQILEPVASNLMPWSFCQAQIGNILLVPSHLRKMYTVLPPKSTALDISPISSKISPMLKQRRVHISSHVRFKTKLKAAEGHNCF